MINVPERNRAVKKLLEATYGKGCVSVRAGNGSAYLWIEITFKTTPDALKSFTWHSIMNTIEMLLRANSIEFSTFPADDAGRPEFGKYSCINITMPPIPRDLGGSLAESAD